MNKQICLRFQVKTHSKDSSSSWWKIVCVQWNPVWENDLNTVCVWSREFFSMEASTSYLTQFCYKERIKYRPCAQLSVNTQLRSMAMETSARLQVRNIIVLVPTTFFPFLFFTHLVHGVYWESKEEARGIACEFYKKKDTGGEKLTWIEVNLTYWLWNGFCSIWYYRFLASLLKPSWIPQCTF